jgi:hypothetical protein
LSGKLDVYQSHPAPVGINTFGIVGLNDDVATMPGLEYTGIYGHAYGVQTSNKVMNRGGYFSSKNSQIAIGVMGEVTDSSQNKGHAAAGNFIAQTNADNYGVIAVATGGKLTYGGRFLANNSPNSNVGIYASAYGNGATNYAGFFAGDVAINGSVILNGVVYPSDSMLKQNVMPLKYADSLLNLLNPVTYKYKVNDYQQLHLDSTEQMGLIAQEVEPIFENIVHITTTLPIFDSTGNIIDSAFTYKTIDYTKFIPVLIAGHQEQNNKIDSLKNINFELQTTNDSLQNQLTNLNTRLTQLENCLSGVLPFLCQLSHNAIQQNTPQAQEAIRQQLSVYLSNKEAIILDQNIPNPFAEQTVINFSIPESVKSAQIHFYDGMGSLIKTVEISQRGLGSITVFGADLSSGTYMYTLVADGINVATKKMVKQ